MNIFKTFWSPKRVIFAQVSSNSIPALGAEFGELTALTALYANSNVITKVAGDFVTLAENNLALLNLANNLIESVGAEGLPARLYSSWRVSSGKASEEAADGSGATMAVDSESKTAEVRHTNLLLLYIALMVVHIFLFHFQFKTRVFMLS